MKEYLHLFDTKANHDAVYNGNGYEEPWVGYIEATDDVSYNKPSWLFDDMVADLSKYNYENLIVTNLDGFQIYLSNSANTLSSIVSGTSKYNVNVSLWSENPIEIPADASFIYITWENEIPGRSFTEGTTYTLQYQDVTETLYIYDFSTMAKHTVNKVYGDKETLETEAPRDFPTLNYEYSPVVQREITNNRVYNKLDVDTVQHFPQLTMNTYGMTRYGVFEYDNDDMFIGIYGLVQEDFFDISGLTEDTTNHVNTLSILPKQLVTEHVNFRYSYSDMFGDVPCRTSCTFILLVDGVEVDRVSGIYQDCSYSYYWEGGVTHRNSNWEIYYDVYYR